MVGSVVINGVIGFIWCIVLLFCLGDPEQVLSSPTGFPFMQIFYNTTGSAAGASVMSLVVSLIAVAANAAGLTSTSRTFWALARDNAMPKAGYFSHVDSKLHVPVRMVVLVSILQFLLGFIYLGNSTAFNAVLSMAILGMYLSYLLPIVYMLIFGRNSGAHVPGPFKLGYAGVFINILALCWLVLAMFFRYVYCPLSFIQLRLTLTIRSTWPNFYPVNATNMNYSTVVLAAWVAIGGTWYAVRGRHKYSGPVVELDARPANVDRVSKA